MTIHVPERKVQWAANVHPDISLSFCWRKGGEQGYNREGSKGGDEKFERRRHRSGNRDRRKERNW